MKGESLKGVVVCSVLDISLVLDCSVVEVVLDVEGESVVDDVLGCAVTVTTVEVEDGIEVDVENCEVLLIVDVL